MSTMLPFWLVEDDYTVTPMGIFQEEVNDLLSTGKHIFFSQWDNGYWNPVYDSTSGIWTEGDEAGKLAFLKVQKSTELDAACQETILGRFTATIQGADYSFSNDMQAQSNFNGTAILFQKGTISSIPWTAYDSEGNRVRLTLSSSDFDAITIAQLKFRNDNTIKYNDLLSQVKAATDGPTLSAIVWS